MSKYIVRFKVLYTVYVDTDDADAYPDSVAAGLSGAEMAEAMVLYDAHKSDDPADVWASWVSAEIVGSDKHTTVEPRTERIR